MLKKKKKSECEYEIDRELTGKFAIEKNAEYQERIAELEEENKKLREENAKLKDIIITDENFEEKQDNEIKKLKERIDELEKCNLNLQERLDRKEELNKGYRKEIKDHQLYEEKLEHRIVEFEELLHGE